MTSAWRAPSLSLRASNTFIDIQFVSHVFFETFTNRTFGIATFAEAKASVSRQKAGVL